VSAGCLHDRNCKIEAADGDIPTSPIDLNPVTARLKHCMKRLMGESFGGGWPALVAV
jgi:hypothetical protein